MQQQISIISFTENGRQLSEKLADILNNIWDDAGNIKAILYTKCSECRNAAADSSVIFVETSVRDWAGAQMQERNAVLFIGALGIAVRAAAPFLTDKLQDPPVLVMDEGGRYVIPVLSGHMGGANELAIYIAERMGAEPVITTSTDINKKFAVDLFAKRNGLLIVNKDGIARASAKVLAGKDITMSIEPGHETSLTVQGDGTETTCLPEGVRLVPYPPAGFVDVAVTSKEDILDASILLRPKEYIIGLGCKKGKKTDEIGRFIKKKISEFGISSAQIFALASISQKRWEPGILEWCRKERVLFLTYTSEELQKTEGNFKKSSFVQEQVGVDNVCERAAMKACGPGGKLIAEKYAENGMTIAVAKREWMVRFRGEFYEE